MRRTFPSILLAIAGALLLGACGSRGAQSGATKPLASRAAEYRAAMDAYTVGRLDAALSHFRAAAEQGNANAQYYTGLMYANGEGTEQNYAEAAKWYQKAAAQDQPDALVQLARLYVTGSGVQADASKAVELFGRAAKVYPPGEKREQVMQQKTALATVIDSSKVRSE